MSEAAASSSATPIHDDPQPQLAPSSVRAFTRPAGVSATAWGWRHGGRKAWALNGVDLTIAPGERILVLGPSGSGKSTLMAGLAGLLGGEDEGEATGSLLVDGRPPEEQRGRIGLVMQDPEAQVVLAKVGDDVAFGMENLAVPREKIWPRVSAALNKVDLRVGHDRATSQLSGGQKQRLALASVLAMEPGLLLLDEPTANLDPAGVSEVRSAVERVLDSCGATLVVIEHRVNVWADLVDRIVVILDGKIAADGPLEEILSRRGEELRDRGIWLPGFDQPSGLADRPTGKTDKQKPTLNGPNTTADDRGDAPEATPILKVRDLSIGYDKNHPVRSGINLDIERGVSTCIVGENGAGKTTLALTLAGLLPSLSGSISAAPKRGLPGTVADPHEWKSAELLGRISMVFQEPEYQFVGRSVREELEIGPRKTGIEGEALDTLVDEHVRALGLDTLVNAHPMTLSGGEKRRLSVASAIISAPELLILDEPTFGQDRKTWIELVRLLAAARDRGTTLVSITHDPAFVEAMGERIIDCDEVGYATPNAPTRASDPKIPAPPPSEAPTKVRRSILDAVNPVTQVLALILMTTPLLASIDIVSAGTALVLELGFVVAARMSLKTLALRMVPILLAAPLASLSMLLYADAEGSAVLWSLGPAAISTRSEALAAGILLRVLALGLPAILLLSRIDPTDMADGFAQVLHLPARPVLATLAAARMTGLMLADWKALEQARRVRGIGDSRRIISAARGSFALLVFALRRSAKLSLTMEARGFGAPWPRTWARESHLGAPDCAMLLAALAVPIIALGAAIATGHFEGLV